MVSTRNFARMVIVTGALLAMGGSRSEAAGMGDNRLSHHEDADLIDLLDAELDETLLNPGSERLLQEGDNTAAPTPAPTPAIRGITMSPTMAPTSSDRDIDFTAAPTPSETAMDTSGVWRPVPSGAVALGAVILTLMSGAAIVA